MGGRPEACRNHCQNIIFGVFWSRFFLRSRLIPWALRNVIKVGFGAIVENPQRAHRSRKGSERRALRTLPCMRLRVVASMYRTMCHLYQNKQSQFEKEVRKVRWLKLFRQGHLAHLRNGAHNIIVCRSSLMSNCCAKICAGMGPTKPV